MLRVKELLTAHTTLRTQSCINLMSSENVMSLASTEAFTNDLSCRYHAEWYAGTVHIQELFKLVKELACQLFKAERAWISPLSGNIADLAVIFAFTDPGDSVGSLSFSDGGYPLEYSYFQRKHLPLAYSRDMLTLDAEKSCVILEEHQPSLVFLGASFIPFPQPVRDIARCVHEYGGILAYDASHPLGLIAGGQFQDPLREGADILLGSTHKSFPGPQGGIILSYDQFYEKLERVIGEDPLKGIVLVDNLHNGRIAALGVTLEEMILNGEQYARQIVRNSHSLANGLSEGGSNLLVRTDGRASDSHQVCIDIPNFQIGGQLRDKLARYGIFTDMGLRFGTCEVTRKGYVETDMLRLGEIISRIMQEESDLILTHELLERIHEMSRKHQSIVI